MAHTMEHPFAGQSMTSCSYGAQAVAKAAKTVTPKYKGKPMSQMDLSTTWIKEFSKHPPGPVVTWTKTISGVEHKYLVTKVSDEAISFKVIKAGKTVETLDSASPKLLQGWAQNYAKNGWEAEWKYPLTASDGLGVTEAGFEAANAAGSWEAAVAKASKGELKHEDIIATGLDKSGALDVQWRLSLDQKLKWQEAKWKVEYREPNTGTWIQFGGLKSTQTVTDTFFTKGGIFQSDVRWRFGKARGPLPAVSPQSTSIGAMADKDAATLFVQIKDEIALKRGINIKGVNKALDDAVYQKIAELTGYTPAEILAKVERYKAAGNKLSSLKKATLGKGKKLDATKYAKQETVDSAVEELTNPKYVDSLGLYRDEDVAKAYIRAKDHVASLDTNKWTLYSADPKFDDAIRAYMKSEFKIDVTYDKLQTHLASYIARDGKLSVLKKKMIKSGEMEAKADTLKGTKFLTKEESKVANADTASTVPHADTVKVPTVGGSAPQITAEQLADLRYVPPGTPVRVLTQVEESHIASSLSGTYLSASEETLFGKFYNIAKELSDTSGSPVSTMDVIRSYDAYKAKQLGVQNAFLYEKKVGEWASSPSGQAYLKNNINFFNAKTQMPPLPKDSAIFTVPSVQDGYAFQQRQTPWTQSQREALRRYTSSSDAMNGAGRSGQKVTGSTADYMKEAWKGMRPLDRPMLLTRGTSIRNFNLPPGATDQDLMKMVGQTFGDRGFTSASVERGGFGGSVLMEIEAPIGTQGTFVEGISTFGGGREKELLLAPNTHYKILRVETRGHQTVVRCRVVHSTPYSDATWRKYGYG